MLNCFWELQNFLKGLGVLVLSVMEQITKDLKVAMKAREKFRTQVLRMVVSEFKYAMTSGTKEESLEDSQAIKILSSYQKRLTKSLDDYPDGEKKDEIRQEIKIVEEYLPKKVDEKTLEDAIDQVLGETDDRQFGVLMKLLMGKFGASADGKMLSALLKRKLEDS